MFYGPEQKTGIIINIDNVATCTMSHVCLLCLGDSSKGLLETEYVSSGEMFPLI